MNRYTASNMVNWAKLGPNAGRARRFTVAHHTMQPLALTTRQRT